MKLLYCKNCEDVYPVRTTAHKQCHCGDTGGIEEDGVVVYHGDPFFLELDTETLSNSMSNQMQLKTTFAQAVGLKLLPVDTAGFRKQ